MRFGLNIDHIVTLREIRKTYEPEILEALFIAKNTHKVDLITIHLREDKRHIQNEDVLKLLEISPLPINIECSINAEITDFLCSLKNKPSKVTIVPENRNEVTTEGGLDCSLKGLEEVIRAYHNKGIEVSLFIDPLKDALHFAREHQVKQVEFHTGVYANLHNALYSNANNQIHAISALKDKSPKELKEELHNAFLQLRRMSKEAFFMGIVVCAGHGLNYTNVKELLKIPSLRELNIGHSVISKAVLVGLEKAILEMSATHQAIKWLKKKIAISCGDIQGVGLELILKSHKEVSAFCEPLYLIDGKLLERANQLLNNAYETKTLNTLAIHSPLPLLNSSTIGKVSAQSGAYSFESFKKACELADSKEVDGICTLPINKLAWQQAQIPFVGHTDFLKQRYQDHQIIMMLGCSKLFVGLFSDHVPLGAVSQLIQVKALVKFLLAFQKSTQAQIVQVCGFNPHAGEEGLFGEEDEKILKAIQKSNQTLGFECFLGPLPADSAFAPNKRKITPFYVSMSHDVGLAPLKALYFDESINVSLNAPILRTSTDHGTAFDIAYQNKANNKSYLNAIKYLA